MDRLTRLITALLRYAEPMLPGEHRAWARALRTEALEVPAGWPRLAWLAGGVRFTVRAAVLNSGLGYPLAFAAAAAGTAWSAWSSGPPGDSAAAINRTDVIAISVILAGLPWAVRRAVMAGYAVMILAGTTRRSPVIPADATVAADAGGALGLLIYALGPLGVLALSPLAGGVVGARTGRAAVARR